MRQRWRTMRNAALVVVTIATIHGGLWLRLKLATPTITFSGIDRLNAERLSPREESLFPDLAESLELPKVEVSYAALREGPEYERDDATNWLAAHQDTVAQLRELTRRPRLGLTFASGVSTTELGKALNGSMLVVNAGGPGWGIVRHAARVLAADARVAAVAGDSVRVAENLLAILRLVEIGGHDARGDLEMLVSQSVAGSASLTVRSVFTEFPLALSEPQLASIDRAFANIPSRLFDIDAATASLAADDLLQRCCTDDGEGNGRVTTVGLAYLGGAEKVVRGSALSSWPWEVVALTFPTRRESKAAFDEYLVRIKAELAKPIIEQSFAESSSENPGPAWPDLILSIRSVHACSMLRPIVFAARTAIAIARHRQLHGGAEPESVAAIDPAAIGVPLSDPFDGKPLRSLYRNGRLVIYSIGFDGDDDSAKCLSPTSGNAIIDEVPPVDESGDGPRDGDWIVYGPLR